jgi:hypothetical protein
MEFYTYFRKTVFIFIKNDRFMVYILQGEIECTFVMFFICKSTFYYFLSRVIWIVIKMCRV